MKRASRPLSYARLISSRLLSPRSLPCQEELPEQLQITFRWKLRLPASLRWIPSSPPRPCVLIQTCKKSVYFESELSSEYVVKVYNSGNQGENWEGIYLKKQEPIGKQNSFCCSKERHKARRKHTVVMVKYVAL